MNSKPLVVVAGASGFVGKHLRHSLASQYNWRALTRSASIASNQAGNGETEWRQCDLYSLPQVEGAMRGAQYALYLVHSMLPSSRLVQGSFQDMDLLLADNFARAAESADVRHIIYLGGLIPELPESKLSPHLASRLEVETVLRSRGIPVTSLRAGLIFGPGGSSTQMLINIVRRLPVMILPKWTRSSLQTVDIEDVLRAFEISLKDESLWGGTYDLASHPEMSYRELILKTKEILGKRRLTVDFPYNFFGLSCLWVSLFGGVSKQLVRPLLDSLKHDLMARDNPLLNRIFENAVPLEASIRGSINDSGAPLAGPRSKTQKKDNVIIRQARQVRSVQRMPLPEGWNAPRVSIEYSNWLTQGFHQLLNVKQDEKGALRFYGPWTSLLLLELTPTPFSLNSERRRAFYITGGLLSKPVDPQGLFQFLNIKESQCIIAAIHGYAPRLPWYLYNYSQALIHLWVMQAFGRHLNRVAKKIPGQEMCEQA